MKQHSTAAAVTGCALLFRRNSKGFYWEQIREELYMAAASSSAAAAGAAARRELDSALIEYQVVPKFYWMELGVDCNKKKLPYHAHTHLYRSLCSSLILVK